MTERIRRQLDMIVSREHRKLRRTLTEAELSQVKADIQNPALSYIERHTRRLELFLQMEKPVLLPDSRIQMIRTISEFPSIYADGELDEIRRTHYVHEEGRVCNIACDYATVLAEGLEGRRARLLKDLDKATTEQKEFASYVERTIDAAEAFADRYADLEEGSGMTAEAAALRRIIREGASSFEEALQLFRALHFVLWASGAYHCTAGRFDQYMEPYYRADIEKGLLTDEAAQELVEDFFLSFNRDSDLYFGAQMGDNGQSMVLGGCKADGSCAVNPLTYIAIRASLALHRIDPKINLRCDDNTPEDLYTLGTELTRAGLGFPQYANDNVVIPGLTALGYELEDARDYVVAACWEFIIPGKGMDIPNIGAVSLAEVARDAIRDGLKDSATFADLKAVWKAKLNEAAQKAMSNLHDLYLEPAPYHSVLMSDCMEQKKDIADGGKYNNFGFHGTGFATGVDQMAAVQRMVYEEGSVSKDELLAALENDFADAKELQYRLRHDAPKMGRDPEAKALAEEQIDMFHGALSGMVNERGGIVRAGTGTAMFYVNHAKDLGATADGRSAGEWLPANYSPSLFISEAGLLSVINGFAESNLSKAINGGPLTLELHDSIFNAPDSIEKVAKMVSSYIRLGGHQLQLNSVNVERMRDAQLHPEQHGDLVVRVWGWSGHFVELAKRYQDHIIARTEFEG